MMTSEAVPQKEMLLEALDSFTRASSSLQVAYDDLQGRVSGLSERLEKTNYYLTTVLQSLPCGVIVVNAQGDVTTINEMARELFSVPDRATPFSLASILDQGGFSDRAREINQRAQDATEITLSPNGQQRVLHCRWSKLRAGERILVAQDMTRVRELEDKMRAAERVAAMGEMALEVAHEIRNPLGALELFTSLLGEDDLTEQERDRYLGNLQIGIRTLNTVLSNMLSLRKQREPNLTLVAVGDVLAQVASMMSPLLDQRGITLELKQEVCPRVELDEEMLKQVLTNLVTNALQALPQGGTLGLRSFCTEHCVIAEVEDDGIGMSGEQQERAFDSGFTTSNKGSGLGLAIVDRFVRAMGGSVELESREGAGTLFRLRFECRETQQ